MRALITGGAGFIGSHLAERLLLQGHHVTVIDNLATGSIDNLRHLLRHPHFELVAETVLNEPVVAHLIRGSDLVYHLAAAVGVRFILDHPLLSLRTNIRATEVVLEQASRFAKPVFLASTSEVYGKNDQRALREEDDSILGSTQISRWLYANSKATDEFLALAYHREQRLPVVIARFFNTIGPRQTGQYGMVVPRFVQQALRGEALTVYGDGQQTRCFTDVRDAVEAITRLMATPAAVGETFNIGSDREITIEELACMVVRMTGSASPIRCVPYEQVYERGFEDMRRRVPDVSKLRATIGFAPAIPLERTLERIIASSRHPQTDARQTADPRRREPSAGVPGEHPRRDPLPAVTAPERAPSALGRPLPTPGNG
jgi:UDP-glucose 4-epimerase